MSRKRVEMWPTSAKWIKGPDGQLRMRVLATGPKPGRPEPEPQPSSRRGIATQGAFDL